MIYYKSGSYIVKSILAPKNSKKNKFNEIYINSQAIQGIKDCYDINSVDKKFFFLLDMKSFEKRTADETYDNQNCSDEWYRYNVNANFEIEKTDFYGRNYHFGYDFDNNKLYIVSGDNEAGSTIFVYEMLYPLITEMFIKNTRKYCGNDVENINLSKLFKDDSTSVLEHFNEISLDELLSKYPSFSYFYDNVLPTINLNILDSISNFEFKSLKTEDFDQIGYDIRKVSDTNAKILKKVFKD